LGKESQINEDKGNLGEKYVMNEDFLEGPGLFAHIFMPGVVCSCVIFFELIILL
jgi:hypothetical protein